jgi:hypothetical protein
MEIDSELKDLYKHWELHTVKSGYPVNEIMVSKQQLDDIIWFINERLEIYERKSTNKEKPYTEDKILSTYRFCNIYREFDKQTVFYHKYLKHLESNFALWLLNMLFCRSVCNTETIEKVGLLSFDESNNTQILKKLKELPSPKYGNAYVFPISVIQKSMWSTREKFFCTYYPLIAKKVASKIQNFSDVSVKEALGIILPIFGFNLKFLFTEVFIDIAYQYPQHINLFKQFPVGPGSLPTIKLLSKESDPESICEYLAQQRFETINYPTYYGKKIFLSSENWEGIGCEYRKYSNLKKGEGRKRYYSA